MLRSHKPLKNQCNLASDSETESDDLSTYFSSLAPQKNTKEKSNIEQDTTSQSVKEGKQDLETLLKYAEMYQDYMKGIPIPTGRASIIPYHTWQELGKSIKQLYKQPLHYLTNVQLKEWDKARINTEGENVPMDTFVHPAKAEATIWLIEEIHRGKTSHHYLGRLWLNEPMYRAFMDPIICLPEF